jgi:hypothetical protein
MTTLKSFQAEIEQISHEKHKLAIKEAREAHAAADLAKHHGKLLKPEVVVEERDEHEDGAEALLEVSEYHGGSRYHGRKQGLIR